MAQKKAQKPAGEKNPPAVPAAATLWAPDFLQYPTTNCRRDLVMGVEQAGISLDDLFALSIEAIKRIKGEIGLG